jgi:hypothetical protein
MISRRDWRTGGPLWLELGMNGYLSDGWSHSLRRAGVRQGRRRCGGQLHISRISPCLYIELLCARNAGTCSNDGLHDVGRLPQQGVVFFSRSSFSSLFGVLSWRNWSKQVWEGFFRLFVTVIADSKEGGRKLLEAEFELANELSVVELSAGPLELDVDLDVVLVIPIVALAGLVEPEETFLYHLMIEQSTKHRRLLGKSFNLKLAKVPAFCVFRGLFNEKIASLLKNE